MEENKSPDVYDVDDTLKLPKNFIPQKSIEEARRNYPGEKIYRYLGKMPGWFIIAVNVLKEMAPDG